jgi:hypothetical protein
VHLSRTKRRLGLLRTPDSLPNNSMAAAAGAPSSSATPIATPPQVLYQSPTETTITVWWQVTQPPPANATGMLLHVREFPKPWADARALDAPTDTATGRGEVVVRGLFPTSTYQFRLVYVLVDGTNSPPGPVTSADTLAAGCVPKEKQDAGAAGARSTKRDGQCCVQ